MCWRRRSAAGCRPAIGHRRHRPGPRGQFRPLAAAGRGGRSRSANGRSTATPASWTRPTWRRCWTRRCGWCCFPHCSNVVGEINDVAAIVRMIHAARRLGLRRRRVSYAPHGLPDVGALGADIYLFSAYKTYGPHQGIMVIRRELGETLPNQGHHFNGGTLYKRFTPAGPDHAQVAACAGMADYIDALHAHHYRRPAEPRLRGGAGARPDARAGERRCCSRCWTSCARATTVRLLGPRDAASARADGGDRLASRPARRAAGGRAGHRTGSWRGAAISMPCAPLQAHGRGSRTRRAADVASSTTRPRPRSTG